ncbi:extra-large guanine nucleotide-binding protein 1 [Quercus suber]|uniref:Extra-large guanine nucleotide-binding protein 1 n=1 Tax=Quercus suber TaxID=58331 RepID=A0AAW0KS05_QUESU
MAGLLKKLWPAAVSAIPENDDEEIFNTEYSIAMEYHGSPVTYAIPQIIPVNISQIPIASPVSSGTLLNNLSLPIIQPIVKSKTLNQKSSKVSVDRIDSSGKLAWENGYESKPKLSHGIGSSGTLEVPDDNKEDGGFQDYMNPTNWESTESGLSSRVPSSEVFSCREDDGNDETPHHVKKPSVTFFEPESSEGVVVHEGIDESEEGSVSMRPKIERLKKGVCYRCHKRKRFAEKEVCIVCGSKFCYDCVLRAMGSMPEGRKCVTCIGYRIDEKRRGTLGKGPRLLKRLLIDLEVKNIMNSEMLCEVNQLPPELVFVNGEALRQDQLFELQNCKNPPKKLRPGHYWYDKVSGFWGKEGQKPSQIITSHLDVGGHVKRNASNGNTNVLINNREITKEELWMLKSAGVPCEGKPHFWVSDDGTYQEEGQKNEKGKIWDKTRTKLFCAVLSLPVPPRSENPSQKEVNGEIRENLAQKSIHKFLLVGYDKSGTSTIYKQAKIVYGIPFSEDERQTIKFLIQRNLFGYLGVLLEGRERFEEESDTIQIDNTTIYSVGERVRAFSDWLLQVLLSDNLEAVFPDATGEYAPFIEEMWKDTAIQATYNRRNELQMLPRVATYFLDRAVEISRTDYEPSDMDILYADGITSSNSLTCMEFSFPKSTQDDSLDPFYQHDSSLRFQLIRVHPRSLGEHCKWLDMFEDTDIVLFCVSMTDYDEYSADCNGVLTNKMLASKHLFESMVTHPTFENKNFLLILNKFDLLEEKIEQVPLSQCEWFCDFKPIVSQNRHNSTNPSLAQRAFHYMGMKFKTLYSSLTDKKLFVSLVTGLENDTVDEALRYAREIIMWQPEGEEPYFNNELSSTDIEASSTT